MSEAAAQAALLALAAYLGIGFLFAVAFAWRGARRLDPAAQRMPLSVRVLVVPGAAALWPLLAVRWLRRQPPPAA